MPKVHKLLITKGIKIISARTEYESIFPGDEKRWKIEAFKKIADEYNTNIITNIIALGDSNFEMQAAGNLATKFKLNFIKTIKFEETPGVSQLIKQQKLVERNFKSVFSSVVNKRITLERKKNQSVPVGTKLQDAQDAQGQLGYGTPRSCKDI